MYTHLHIMHTGYDDENLIIIKESALFRRENVIWQFVEKFKVRSLLSTGCR
jgi:hypothetical protein